MQIYLVRHGETPWNAEGRYQGRSDIPLSPRGQEQATALAARLSDIVFSQAVSSPLSRARTTAEAILKASARPPTLRLDPGFLEISHGEWEGKLSSEAAAANPDMFTQWRTQPNGEMTAGPKAESLYQVQARSLIALQELVDSAVDGENILVVAHDAVNRVLLCHMLGIPLERVWSFAQAPCTLNILSGDRGSGFIVERMNDATHVCGTAIAARHLAL